MTDRIRGNHLHLNFLLYVMQSSLKRVTLQQVLERKQISTDLHSSYPYLMKHPFSWIDHLCTVTLIRYSIWNQLTIPVFSSVVIRDTACFVMASLETCHPVCIGNRVFYQPTKVAILVSRTCGGSKLDQEQERNCCQKHIDQCLFDAI